MKYLIQVLLLFIVSACNVLPKEQSAYVQNADIERFWKAYDQIIATADSSEQRRILLNEYINPGTIGLHAIMDKKGYTVDAYIDAINSYPSFWESVRVNTLKSGMFADEIEVNIDKLKKCYPDLRPAQLYFTIGILRTGGSAHKGHVLIGSELALADSSTITDDIQPEWLKNNLSQYFDSNPINDIVLLNVHEYVHTQQGDYGYDLLSMCVYEGVAEFVSVLAAETESATPAISFGQNNVEKVRRRFKTEMFSPHWNDWLYNDFNNEFGIRDLGYYTGYAICEKYYNKSNDKPAAIKALIELDCTNREAVENLVVESGYFLKSMNILKSEYELGRPQVIGIKEFENMDKSVDPSIKVLTIEFTDEMSTRFYNHRFGPLGREHVLPYESITWSEDRRSVVIGVDLKPARHYQIEIANEYRNIYGRPIDAYLIDFETASE